MKRKKVREREGEIAKGILYKTGDRKKHRKNQLS